MTKIISFVNFKGGVGKTTLTVNTAAALASLEISGRPARVLVVDADSQASATDYLTGHNQSLVRQQKELHLGATIRSFLQGEQEYIQAEQIIGIALPGTVFKGVFSNLHLLASSADLGEIEKRLAKLETPDGPRREFMMLAYLLERIEALYDYILIDCPPHLYWMTDSALFASDFCFVPVIPDWMSSNGLERLIQHIAVRRADFDAARKKLMPDSERKSLSLEAIIFNRYEHRSSVYSRYMTEIEESVKEWKSRPGLAPVLANTKILHGLAQRTAVQKCTQEFDSLLSLPGSDSSRIEIQQIAKAIVEASQR